MNQIKWLVYRKNKTTDVKSRADGFIGENIVFTIAEILEGEYRVWFVTNDEVTLIGIYTSLSSAKRGAERYLKRLQNRIVPRREKYHFIVRYWSDSCNSYWYHIRCNTVDEFVKQMEEALTSSGEPNDWVNNPDDLLYKDIAAIFTRILQKGLMFVRVDLQSYADTPYKTDAYAGLNQFEIFNVSAD